MSERLFKQRDLHHKHVLLSCIYGLNLADAKWCGNIRRFAKHVLWFKCDLSSNALLPLKAKDWVAYTLTEKIYDKHYAARSESGHSSSAAFLIHSPQMWGWHRLAALCSMGPALTLHCTPKHSWGCLTCASALSARTQPTDTVGRHRGMRTRDIWKISDSRRRDIRAAFWNHPV